MSQKGSKWILPAVLSLSAFAADFASKAWANQNLQLGNSVIFIPGFMRFTLARNTGGAWSIGRDNPLFMTILASSIVLGLSFWLWKREQSDSPPGNLERSGIALIMGGAVGNLFDRFTRGEVTDFLDFAFMQFPIFNVADSLIDIGAGLIVISALFLQSKPEAPKDSDKQTAAE